MRLAVESRSGFRNLKLETLNLELPVPYQIRRKKRPGALWAEAGFT
jgi:hypothetical protein